VSKRSACDTLARISNLPSRPRWIARPGACAEAVFFTLPLPSDFGGPVTAQSCFLQASRCSEAPSLHSNPY
jgi:hypothetical protein